MNFYRAKPVEALQSYIGMSSGQNDFVSSLSFGDIDLAPLMESCVQVEIDSNCLNFAPIGINHTGVFIFRLKLALYLSRVQKIC